MMHEITLHLDDVHQLFTAPDFDLFSPHPRDESGIDSILEDLKPLRLRDPLKTILFLPAPQIDKDLPAQVRKAVLLYAEQKIRANDQELASLRWRSFKSLQSGLIFLAVCLLLAAIAEAATFLPSWLSSFINNGFTIIGWVSLWHPAEALLFDWWPYWREKRLYKYISTMEIEITSDSESTQASG